MQAVANTFDGIIDTVSAQHDISQLLPLLKVDPQPSSPNPQEQAYACISAALGAGLRSPTRCCAAGVGGIGPHKANLAAFKGGWRLFRFCWTAGAGQDRAHVGLGSTCMQASQKSDWFIENVDVDVHSGCRPMGT